MNLASNILGGILSSQMSGAQGNITNVFNLDDKTFANILEKQLNVQPIERVGVFPAGMGMPFGLDIQDIGNNINIQKNDDIQINNENDFKQTGFGDFARKHAAEFYGKCAGNVVVNLTEFVNDTMNLN